MKIKVYIKQPGRPPYSTNIENNLENLQRNVEGYVEFVPLAKDFGIIFNEEGMLKPMPYNTEICGMNLYGPVIFIGMKGEEFTNVPCDWKQFKTMFKNLFEEAGNGKG